MIGPSTETDKDGGATEGSQVVGLNREIGRSGDFGVFWREPPEATLEDDSRDVVEPAMAYVTVQRRSALVS
jgi:hypothetical protein